MIRWDPVGEHIIVECLEQLALHVLSVHHQLRFASFSRQLNVSIYFLGVRAPLVAVVIPRDPVAHPRVP